MTYVTTTDATKLYVKEWGQGRPVVLIHGWPLNADSWDDVAMGLAGSGYRTIAYDRRGFGRSDQPWNGYDYDTLADDLAAVLDHCGADGATLVGFSMGGGEVARYLSRHGSARISNAVLVSSVVPFMLQRDDNPDGVPQAQFDAMKENIFEDRPAFMQTFAKLFYGSTFMMSDVSQGVLDWTFQMAMMAGSRPTLACLNAFATTDFRDDCAAFTMPTLIMHGTGDKTVPIDTGGRHAAKLIPHAQVIDYDGGPHGLLTTHKDEVVRDLLAFLRAEAGASGGKENDATESLIVAPTPLQPSF